MRTFISRLLAPLNNLRLRYKILLLCVSLVVFATSLTGFYSYNAAARLVTDQAYSQSRATVTQAANFLDEKLRNVLWLGFFLQTDPAVAAALADGGATEYGAHFSAVQSSFSSVRMREKTVDSALISTPSGDYFETIHITAAPFRETEMYQAARRQEQFIWFPAHPDPLFRGEEPVLTLVLPVSVPEPAEDSFVVVNLSADWFAEYLSKVSQGALLMVDAAGTPVVPASLSPGAAEAIRELRGPYGEVDGDEPLILHQAPIPSTDWRVVLVQPKAALLAGASAIQVAALMVMAVTLAISLFLSFWMAHSIARPLDVLGVLMHQIEARNFGTTFKARYSDEIGDLGRSFNRMSRRLDALVGQVETEQRQKRQAELRALQAQMNPHFLYNTLDSIYWKAQMQDHSAVGEMVLALSRLLRLGLNKGEEITTIGRELEHTETYLRLQKRNYETQFDYRIESDPASLPFHCPKLVLQPIVENSLLHGFANRTEGGQVTVSARLDGDTVVLTVADNGCGLPEGDPTGTGYALKNVQERIRLHYGPGYGMRFAANPGGGTLVEIRLPARAAKEEPVCTG